MTYYLYFDGFPFSSHVQPRVHMEHRLLIKAETTSRAVLGRTAGKQART